MCGICGVFQLRGVPGQPVDAATLGAMTDSMRHRGPNDDGYHLADGVAIGVRRLSIVDVEGGRQPVWNENGTVLAAQNGELYNHKDVRRDLESAGYRFRTTCDTEILPHLYSRTGDRTPEHLNGMFAFVIWDEAQRRGLLARDPLGIKPLYYAEVGDVLVFASELKTVVASGLVPMEVDTGAVDLFLTLGFVPGPRTVLRDVKKLLPGHRLVVEPPAVRVERYWTYPDPAPAEDTPDAEWEAQLLDVLDDAVRSQLMSDVPLGAMLSGGLDSSLVVALMARHTTEPVKTFSVGFAGTPDNELAVARATARALGTEHHELELSLDTPVDLEALTRSLDEPLADLSAIGFSALASLTAEHVTVALSGQGADELLAGYGRYHQIAALDRWANAPLALRRAAALVGRRAPARLRHAGAIGAAADPVLAAVNARSEWASSARPGPARGDLRGFSNSVLEEVVAHRIGGSKSRGVERALVLDGQFALVDDMLHYFDRTSMAHSLEVRVPYLDHRLVEFCSNLPTRLKVSGGVTKRVLRSAARGIVPDFVIDRPKVGFFSSAVNHWFERQVTGAVGDVLLDPGAQYTAFLERDEVERLLRTNGSYRKSKLLLSILMLELWLLTFPQNSPRPAVAVGTGR